MRHANLFALAAVVMAPSAMAQDTLPACQSQQELEQVIASDGAFTPDGCRNLSITEIDADADRLCVIDFSMDDDGVLQALRDAAAPEQWWVRCDALAEAAQ